MYIPEKVSSCSHASIFMLDMYVMVFQICTEDPMKLKKWLLNFTHSTLP
jgi:hypothetical protein